MSAADLSRYHTSDSVLARDVRRFDHFSQGYLYPLPGHAHILGDLRYALFPHSTEALWGIRFDPGQPEQHIEMIYFREPSKAAFQQLWQMIFRPAETATASGYTTLVRLGSGPDGAPQADNHSNHVA